MYFEIDTSNGIPVYQQVYRQVAFAIANGIIHRVILFLR